MIASCKFNDLILSCKSSGNTDCTHNSLCTGIYHTHHIHMWNMVTDEFSHLHFDCSCTSEAEALFTCLQYTFFYFRKIMAQNHRSPGIDIIHIFFSINIINMASVCTVDKSRCNTDSTVCTYRTVYSSRNYLYRSVK